MKTLKTIASIILVGAMTIVGGCTTNNKIAEKPVTPLERYQEVELSKIVKDAIIEKETNEDKKIYILKDDSTIVVNEKENEYLFYPVCMGDWNYTLDNLGQLNMAVETYLSNN